MLIYLITLVLVILGLAGITLEKAYFYLPVTEMERRAHHGDNVAAKLLLAVRYGDELRLLVVALTWLCIAVGVALVVFVSPLLIGLISTIAVLVLAFFWQTRTPLTARGAFLAAWCAPFLAMVASKLQPILRRPARLFKRFHLQRSHTGIYEPADFIDLLKRQQHQRDNRVAPADLERLQRVLEASNYTVDKLMTPIAQISIIKDTDSISPVFVDELHRSGRMVFPVWDESASQVVGALHLRDIADIRQHDTVASALRPGVAYLNRADSIERAVRAYYETGQELFVVVDPKGKNVGILLLDDVLAYTFGKLEPLAFGHFDDPAQVNAPKQ